MRHIVLKDNEKFLKQSYQNEDELKVTFQKCYREVISEKSLWIPVEKQFKSRNFKDSFCDGFLLVWENPSTPLLYVTEIETEEHSIDKHILPQVGNFISFIQRASKEDLNSVRNYLYKDLKKDKNSFKKIGDDTGNEVYELLDNALEDLQILLVIDKMKPELSIGLSQIEKAINIKIRKIEVFKFISNNNNEIISYTDSEEFETTTSIEKETEEYTIEYHLNDKPEQIVKIFEKFMESVGDRVRIIPTKQYIGFYKGIGMIFSCVVRKKSIVFYSKATVKELTKEYSLITFRDVENIGHYTNHLPTEIIVSEISQVSELTDYFNTVYSKY